MASYDGDASSSAFVLSGAEYTTPSIEGVAESSLTIAGTAIPSQVFTMEAITNGTVSGSATAPQVFDLLALSQLEVSGNSAVVREIYAAVSNGLNISGLVAAAAEYYLSVESLAKIKSDAVFINDYFDGYAFNLNTEAPSFYEQFKFNSFAQLGRDYYGMNEDGIHILNGDTDNGEDINAVMTTGLTDFDDGSLKTIPVIYASARSHKEMLLTARVDNYPDYGYAFIGKPAELAPVRVKLGRGLKGLNWQLEVKNKDGAYIEIDALDVPTVSTSRKV
jgi:hypothetical protein